MSGVGHEGGKVGAVGDLGPGFKLRECIKRAGVWGAQGKTKRKNGQK